MIKENEERFEVVIPKRIEKEFNKLYGKRCNQVKKAVTKLQINPINFKDKNIEKLRNSIMGTYTIRVSRGDRIFYNIDFIKKRVILVKAGPHSFYNDLK